MRIAYKLILSIMAELYCMKCVYYVRGLSAARDGVLASQQQCQYCWIQVESTDYNSKADRRKVS